ncbi:MAG: YdbL family protein [Rhodocyclaceae bacterium]|jgi:hypothetical protein|nr:YdbL family protein [Rhodocyclaceae bacterium]
MKRLLILLAFIAAPAVAAPPMPDQINLDIGTPPVIVVKHALAQRYSRLVRFYDAGVMGIDINGMVQIRDYSKLNNLTLRQTAEKLVDQENPDRNSLVYAIAEAHGGKEAIPVVRPLLVKRWREQVKSGWWLQDENGNWVQKP